MSKKYFSCSPLMPARWQFTEVTWYKELYLFLRENVAVCHVVTYRGYTVKQRLIQWLLYRARNLFDILDGIIGLISMGTLESSFSSHMSEKILRSQLDFYKEKKGKS